MVFKLKKKKRKIKKGETYETLGYNDETKKEMNKILLNKRQNY